MEEVKICKHCKKPVVVNAANYEIFENMHWLCFHLVYEHHSDPDEKCGDPSCPWWHIEVMRKKLESLGLDPDEVLEQATQERWGRESNTN